MDLKKKKNNSKSWFYQVNWQIPDLNLDSWKTPLPFASLEKITHSLTFHVFSVSQLFRSEFCQRSRRQRNSWRIMNEFQSHLLSIFRISIRMSRLLKQITSRIPYSLWQYELWSFQTADTKLERFLPRDQHTKRKLLNSEFWNNGELSNSAKIWLSKSIFYVKNHPNLSQYFFFKFSRFLT